MIHELWIETEVLCQSETIRIIFAVFTEFLTLKQYQKVRQISSSDLWFLSIDLPI